MPRKSTAAELQAEEAAVSSPLRRSSRIVSGNGTTPAGVVTRRTSQTLETQASTPAKATRGRRASAQDSEEKIESQPAKTVTRTRRASMLADEESQKETPSTPGRRTRKPSLTTEPTEKDESEKPKSVRGRRTSSSNTTEEYDEKKLPKTAPVRGRRSSANVEPETENKIASKIPARATTRRRSSAAENAVVEEVFTPAKRSTRGRKVSDAEEISVINEEVKKSTARSRKKSDSQEEDGKNAEPDKPAAKRGRKASTDESSVNAAPKTPKRPERRPSINEDVISEELTNKEKKPEGKINEGSDSEEEMSPIILTNVVVKLTPLKKRKILDKVEAELDLSVINESLDDVNNSKHDKSSKEETETIEKEEKNNKVMQRDSPKPTAFNKAGKNITPTDRSFNSADETNIELFNMSGKALDTSARSRTPENKKRSSTGNNDSPSPRKSPRLMVKLSKSNTSKEEWKHQKLPTSKKPRNLMTENDTEVGVTEKSQASFVSSGSDGSFKFHLSNVSTANSGQHDSNKDDIDDVLNTSKESTGSNKENVEQFNSPSISKAVLDVSGILLEPITVGRVSNVFKPNQKNYSFMEPMEVDDSIMLSETSLAKKTTELDQSSINLDQIITENVSKNSLELESSVEFNVKVSLNSKEAKLDKILPSNSNRQNETANMPILDSPKNPIHQNLLETEGSDTNLIIEETVDSVDFSIQPKTKKTNKIELNSQRRSRSPTGNEASLILNQPLEQVKVVLLGKSSSPIITRKSKSPLPKVVDSTEHEHDVPRRSKSRSKSPCKRSDARSPSVLIGSSLLTETKMKTNKPFQNSDALLIIPRRSKSKSRSPSPRRSSNFLNVDGNDQNKSRQTESPVKGAKRDPKNSAEQKEESTASSRRSQSKSPRPRKISGDLCVDIGDKVKPRKSKSSRSKSNSPSSDFEETPVSRDGRKSRSVRSKSKSPRPGSEGVLNDNVSPTMLIKTKPESPLTAAQESSKIQSSEEVIKSENSLPLSQDSPIVKNESVIRRSIRSKSKSPMPESTLLEQSFEKPKGTEEVVVITEKKYTKPSKLPKDKDPCLKSCFDSVTSQFCTTTESQVDLSEINNTSVEQTNIQDKTEYHTAMATTNNESAFTSVLNVNNEITQSLITDSSPHYDFDLDSDDDDLINSQEKKSDVGSETNELDKRTVALQKELVVELKKSFSKSKISADTLEKSKSVVDKEKSEEKSKIKVLVQVHSSSERKNNESYSQKDQANHLTSTEFDTKEGLANQSSKLQEEDLLTKDSKHASLEEESKETVITPNMEIEDRNEKSDLSIAKSVNDISDKNVEADFKEISDEEDEKSVLQEQFNESNQHIISNKECHTDESQVEAVDKKDVIDSRDLHKVDKSNENEQPKAEANEEIHPIINENAIEVHATEHALSANDENKEQESRQENECEHNISTIQDSGRNSSKKSDKKTRSKNQEVQKEDYNPEYMEELTTCEAGAQEGDKSQLDHTSFITKVPTIKEDSISVKTKPSIDEFASSKLEEYLNSQADELYESSSEGEEEESDAKYNDFIDGMAEEGEEDTPSEDSNQIIDEGESIGFSSAEELSDDDYDDNDSFICDEEESELLSGEEYDLDNIRKSKKCKKSRIIDSNLLGDEDIIKISEKKREQKNEPRKRSRIISVSDSSDEEQDIAVSGIEIKEKSVKEDEENVLKDETDSIILIEESAQHDDTRNVDTIDESKTTDTNNPIIIEDSKTEGCSTESLTDESHAKNINDSVVTKESNNESVCHNLSLGDLSASIQRRNRKSSLSIQENIVVDGVQDPLITKRINTLVESFCSTVKQGEISLNLSLEYEDSPQEGDKKKTVHVLSDIKIYAGKPIISEDTEGENKNTNFEGEQNESVSNVTLSEAGDLREVLNKKNLKRKLSKSLNEINEEVAEAKKRKTGKREKGKKKITTTKKVIEASTGKSKKRDKMHTNLRKEVQSTISSFSIMNQLITDVKSRPKRTIKPTKTDAEIENTWTTKIVTNLKPSTSPVTKQERIKIQPKIHPKDFKNQMLCDGKRVKRIDTKTLLKKKGAY